MSKKSKALEFANDAYNISIQGRHVQVTDAMQDYAKEKLSRLERLFDRIIDLHVIMDIQKLEHRVEIVLKVNNHTIMAKVASDDMYKSIDLAVDKLLMQVRRYKSRINDHRKGEISAEDMLIDVLQVRDEEELNEAIEQESIREMQRAYSPLITKEKVVSLKMLSEGEAVRHMLRTSDIFYVYRAEEDLSLKIIYRTKEGHLAIMHPE